jgi:hypothetical protein
VKIGKRVIKRILVLHFIVVFSAKEQTRSLKKRQQLIVYAFQKAVGQVRKQ